LGSRIGLRGENKQLLEQMDKLGRYAWSGLIVPLVQNRVNPQSTTKVFIRGGGGVGGVGGKNPSGSENGNASDLLTDGGVMVPQLLRSAPKDEKEG